MPAEAKMYEPRLALDGGPDGLEVLRRAASGASEWLARGGHLVIGTSRAQAGAGADAFAAAGVAPAIASDEDLGATGGIGPPLGRRSVAPSRGPPGARPERARQF